MKKNINLFFLKQDTDISYQGIVFISCMYLYFIITCENTLELFRESLYSEILFISDESFKSML